MLQLLLPIQWISIRINFLGCAGCCELQLEDEWARTQLVPWVSNAGFAIYTLPLILSFHIWEMSVTICCKDFFFFNDIRLKIVLTKSRLSFWLFLTMEKHRWFHNHKVLSKQHHVSSASHGQTEFLFASVCCYSITFTRVNFPTCWAKGSLASSAWEKLPAIDNQTS